MLCRDCRQSSRDHLKRTFRTAAVSQDYAFSGSSAATPRADIASRRYESDPDLYSFGGGGGSILCPPASQVEIKPRDRAGTSGERRHRRQHTEAAGQIQSRWMT